MRQIIDDIMATEMVSNDMKTNYGRAKQALNITKGGLNHEFANDARRLQEQIMWCTGKVVHIVRTWGLDGDFTMKDVKDQAMKLFKEYKQCMENFMTEERYSLIPTNQQMVDLLSKVESIEMKIEGQEMVYV
jgi:hypothetical protein